MLFGAITRSAFWHISTNMFRINNFSKEPFMQTFPLIAEQARTLTRTAQDAGRAIVAVSVSVGGPLRIDEGFLIDPPHLPGWRGVELKQHLEQAFPGLPVMVEHDGGPPGLLGVPLREDERFAVRVHVFAARGVAGVEE